MKTAEKIEKAMDKAKESGNKYSGMTYEEGVVNALEWVLEILDDEDFEYTEYTERTPRRAGQEKDEK